jgi:hypothetical protein
MARAFFVPGALSSSHGGVGDPALPNNGGAAVPSIRNQQPTTNNVERKKPSLDEEACDAMMS